jgi:hypothetical protein
MQQLGEAVHGQVRATSVCVIPVWQHDGESSTGSVSGNGGEKNSSGNWVLDLRR